MYVRTIRGLSGTSLVHSRRLLLLAVLSVAPAVDWAASADGLLLLHARHPETAQRCLAAGRFASTPSLFAYRLHLARLCDGLRWILDGHASMLSQALSSNLRLLCPRLANALGCELTWYLTLGRAAACP